MLFRSGGLFLIPVIYSLNKINLKLGKETKKNSPKMLLLGSICCGVKGRIIHATFNLGKALHIDTDFVRKFLLFHSSMLSYGLYVLS